MRADTLPYHIIWLLTHDLYLQKMHPRIRHPFDAPAPPRPIALIPPARAALAGPRRPLTLHGQLDLAHFPGQAERAAIPGIPEGLYLAMQAAYDTHSFHYRDGHNPLGSTFVYETSVIPRHAVSFNMANLYVPELPNPIIQLYPGTTGLLRNIDYQMDLREQAVFDDRIYVLARRGSALSAHKPLHRCFNNWHHPMATPATQLVTYSRSTAFFSILDEQGTRYPNSNAPSAGTVRHLMTNDNHHLLLLLPRPGSKSFKIRFDCSSGAQLPANMPVLLTAYGTNNHQRFNITWDLYIKDIGDHHRNPGHLVPTFQTHQRNVAELQAYRAFTGNPHLWVDNHKLDYGIRNCELPHTELARMIASPYPSNLPGRISEYCTALSTHSPVQIDSTEYAQNGEDLIFIQTEQPITLSIPRAEGHIKGSDHIFLSVRRVHLDEHNSPWLLTTFLEDNRGVSQTAKPYAITFPLGQASQSYVVHKPDICPHVMHRIRLGGNFKKMILTFSPALKEHMHCPLHLHIFGEAAGIPISIIHRICLTEDIATTMTEIALERPPYTEPPPAMQLRGLPQAQHTFRPPPPQPFCPAQAYPRTYTPTSASIHSASEMLDSDSSDSETSSPRTMVKAIKVGLPIVPVTPFLMQPAKTAFVFSLCKDKKIQVPDMEALGPFLAPNISTKIQAQEDENVSWDENGLYVTRRKRFLLRLHSHITMGDKIYFSLEPTQDMPPIRECAHKFGHMHSMNATWFESDTHKKHYAMLYPYPSAGYMTRAIGLKNNHVVHEITPQPGTKDLWFQSGCGSDEIYGRLITMVLRIFSANLNGEELHEIHQITFGPPPIKDNLGRAMHFFSHGWAPVDRQPKYFAAPPPTDSPVDSDQEFFDAVETTMPKREKRGATWPKPNQSTHDELQQMAHLQIQHHAPIVQEHPQSAASFPPTQMEVTENPSTSTELCTIDKCPGIWILRPLSHTGDRALIPPHNTNLCLPIRNAEPTANDRVSVRGRPQIRGFREGPHLNHLRRQMIDLPRELLPNLLTAPQGINRRRECQSKFCPLKQIIPYKHKAHICYLARRLQAIQARERQARGEREPRECGANESTRIVIWYPNATWCDSRDCPAWPKYQDLHRTTTCFRPIPTAEEAATFQTRRTEKLNHYAIDNIDPTSDDECASAICPHRCDCHINTEMSRSPTTPGHIRSECRESRAKQAQERRRTLITARHSLDPFANEDPVIRPWNPTQTFCEDRSCPADRIYRGLHRSLLCKDAIPQMEIDGLRPPSAEETNHAAVFQRCNTPNRCDQQEAGPSHQATPLDTLQEATEESEDGQPRLPTQEEQEKAGRDAWLNRPFNWKAPWLTDPTSNYNQNRREFSHQATDTSDPVPLSHQPSLQVCYDYGVWERPNPDFIPTEDRQPTPSPPRFQAADPGQQSWPLDKPLNPGLVIRCYKRTQAEGPLTLQPKSTFDLEREAMDPQSKRKKRALSDLDPNIFEYQVPRMRFEDPLLDVVNQYEIEASKSGPHDEQAMMDLSQKDVYIRTPAQRRVARETYNLAKQANPDFNAAFKNSFRLFYLFDQAPNGPISHPDMERYSQWPDYYDRISEDSIFRFEESDNVDQENGAIIIARNHHISIELNRYPIEGDFIHMNLESTADPGTNPDPIKSCFHETHLTGTNDEHPMNDEFDANPPVFPWPDKSYHIKLLPLHQGEMVYEIIPQTSMEVLKIYANCTPLQASGKSIPWHLRFTYVLSGKPGQEVFKIWVKERDEIRPMSDRHIQPSQPCPIIRLSSSSSSSITECGQEFLPPTEPSASSESQKEPPKQKRKYTKRVKTDAPRQGTSSGGRQSQSREETYEDIKLRNAYMAATVKEARFLSMKEVKRRMNKIKKDALARGTIPSPDYP